MGDCTDLERVTLVIPERRMFLQQMGQTDIQLSAKISSSRPKLVFPSLQVAYTLDGNGERSLYDGSSTGLSVFHGLLENQGLKINKLNLLREATIPDDAAVVLVFEPTSSLSLEQQGALLQYIRRGGRVWFSSGYSHNSLLSPIGWSP